MSDSQRTDPADQGPLSEADRAARIEQLLLSGLDQYFGGNYEQAVNIWTRVAFLERGHGRARAYIERARGALAERQRQSEETLHDGVAAYQGGNLQTARTLLTQAVEQGGAIETALPLLERLGRLDAVRGTRLPGRTGGHASPRSSQSATQRPTNWWKTIAASAAIASLFLVGAMRTASWLREPGPVPRVAEIAPQELMPIVRGSEIRLRRAQALFASGQMQAALDQIESVTLGDPLRPEADRVRAAIQRAVLSTVGETATQAGERKP